MVARELFGDELVVGKVCVEGADDVVAIGPGVFAVEVGFGAVGFGPADDIEPMLGPAFAEVGGGQLGIDESGVGFFGIGSIGFFEGGHFFGCGRKSGEGDVDALDECPGVGGRVGSEAGIFEFCLQEGVDGVFSLGGRGGAFVGAVCFSNGVNLRRD